VLAPHEDGSIITVMDVSGLAVRKLASAEGLALLRASSEILSKYYPQKVSRIFVINLPSWLTSAWSVINSVLPASIKDRVVLATSPNNLFTCIDPEDIPMKYGGSNQLRFEESPDEILMTELVSSVRAGKEFIFSSRHHVNDHVKEGIMDNPTPNPHSGIDSNLHGMASPDSTKWRSPPDTQSTQRKGRSLVRSASSALERLFGSVR